MTRILMIDDDTGLASPLITYFTRYDLQLDHADHPHTGLEMLKKGGDNEAYALVILDIMLPDQDGFEVCREIRQFSEVPIIMLTARGEVTDRIVGLELGADDYLPKPFDPRELVARIQSILKRVKTSNQALQPAEETGPLKIDLARQEVELEGKTLELTTREFNLLALLSQEPGRVWSRDDIMNHLRGTDADIFSRVIDISISRLRKRLKPLDPIKTVWGKGYRWVL
ncbi:MAG: response regulator transcription factor [Gammaproteobacteria bacterium]|nr:response regulator transcription factor [Gammaproteobacteria bacterium]